MKIREIMTTEIATASPETTLEEIATMMKRDDIGSVPILEDNELCGIVTDRDIVIRAIAEGLHPGDTRAEQILTEDLHTVEADDDSEAAADLMAKHQIRRLPVIENGKLVGMVAIGDIAVKIADDKSSGDTLENVSRGVKSQRRKPQRSTGKSERDMARSAATRGRAIKTEQQGISNRKAGEEVARNERVIPIREDARASGRKPATRKKAG